MPCEGDLQPQDLRGILVKVSQWRVAELDRAVGVIPQMADAGTTVSNV